jgi:hypothetical protein
MMNNAHDAPHSNALAESERQYGFAIDEGLVPAGIEKKPFIMVNGWQPVFVPLVYPGRKIYKNRQKFPAVNNPDIN